MKRERDWVIMSGRLYYMPKTNVCVCVCCQQGKIDAEMLNDIRCI